MQKIYTNIYQGSSLREANLTNPFIKIAPWPLGRLIFDTDRLIIKISFTTHIIPYNEIKKIYCGSDLMIIIECAGGLKFGIGYYRPKKLVDEFLRRNLPVLDPKQTYTKARLAPLGICALTFIVCMVIVLDLWRTGQLQNMLR